MICFLAIVSFAHLRAVPHGAPGSQPDVRLLELSSLCGLVKPPVNRRQKVAGGLRLKEGVDPIERETSP